MTDKIQTAQLADLISIFDPTVQEPDDVGGARILYTFADGEEPKRERVGEHFILDVLEPEVSFFVSVSTEGSIEEGTIVTATPLDGVRDRYSLASADLKRLIFDVGTALGYDEETIADLLDT